MSLKIKTLAETIEPDKPKMMVYAFAGAGKTTLCSTLPGKVLIISAESGLLSLQGKMEADVLEVSSIDDLRDAYGLLKTGDHQYDWVCLDSFSEIAEVMLAHEKSQTKDARQAYGKVIEQGVALARAFRDLKGLGVYFTCKAERQKDEATGRIQVTISMPGARLAQSIPYLFDEVFCLITETDKETGKTQRWLQTCSDARADCKDRSGRLDAYEPADLGHVVSKIAGGGQ